MKAPSTLLLCLLPSLSHARDRGATSEGMLMPDLSRVLGDAWQVPPELSDRAVPGSVLEIDASGLKVVMSGCIGVSPNENTLTDVSMSNNLSGGVGWGSLGGAASGRHTMKLSFQGPTVVNFELIDFVPAAACVDRLTAFARRGGDMSRLVVVQETIMARVSGCENTSVSAGVDLPAVGASVAAGGACQMFSDAPVVVGYKVVAFSDIPELAGLSGATTAAASPSPPPKAGKAGRSKPSKAPPDKKNDKKNDKKDSGSASGKADNPKKVKPKQAIEALRPRANQLSIRVPDGPYRQDDVDALERRIARQQGFAARVAPLAEDAAIIGVSLPEHPMKEDRVEAVEAAVAKARAAPKYRALVADFQAFCAIRPNGEPTCWDDGDASPVTAVPAGVRFEKISLGMAVGCGLTLDKTLRCWGKPYNSGVDRPPSGTWEDFSFNDNGGCALSASGRLKCWGGDHFNYRQFKAKTVPSGTWSAVISGDYHNCGIRTDGKTVCWGNRSGGQKGAPYTVAADIVRFTSAGDGGSTCGITRDGRGACWSGPDNLGFTQGRYSDVAGTYRKTTGGDWERGSCGVKTDGTLGCEFDDGPTPAKFGAAPEGQFERLVYTLDQSCVLDRLGQVRCWEYNRR